VDAQCCSWSARSWLTIHLGASWRAAVGPGKRHDSSEKNFAVSATLSIRVAGIAVAAPCALNLRDFERLQGRLRLE